MNCSESQRLRTLLSHLLLELYHRGNASTLGSGTNTTWGWGVVPDPFRGHEVTSVKGYNAYVYIPLIMILYSCLARGLILAYTHSHKFVEAKDETSQPSSEHQWAVVGALAITAKTAIKPPAEGCSQSESQGLPTLAQSTQGI
ncbi:potassium voltage-gated channel subfamily E regulatory beta subunit 5 [Glossophaga mutica]